MNWTEGSLARHSRGRQAKQVLLRQKEHFAKARAGLLPSASKRSPPSFSFLHQSSSPLSRHSRLSHLSRPSRPPQRHSPLHVRRPTGESPQGSSNKKRSRETPTAGHDVTSLPAFSRYFEAGSDGQPPGPPTVPLAEDAFHEKRRKLLLKGDWVGVGMQKPIPVNFSSDHLENRKWSKHHRSANSKTRHLLGSRYDQMKASHERIPTTPRPRDVTIRIGSQEMRLGNRFGNRLGSNDPSCPPTDFKAGPASHRHEAGTLSNSTSSRKL